MKAINSPKSAFNKFWNTSRAINRKLYFYSTYTTLNIFKSKLKFKYILRLLN